MQAAILKLLLCGLGRDALKVAAGLVLALLIALAFAIASVMALFYAVTPGHEVASARVDEIPPDQLAAMRAAAATCGLPWQALAAVAKVESDFGRNMATSSAGAVGYGQFLPSTWDAYGRGGDPYDYRTALPAMARYLCDHGGAADLRGALYAYNHAGWYVDQVAAVAVKYGYAPPGAPTTRVVDLARAQTGMPYAWGGASPETSFDCSGLVQWSYRQIGVSLPRTAQQQYDATARIPSDALRPGDLLFFANTYKSDPSEPITHVGIYVGDGRMINAPTDGDVVREMPAFTGFWGSHFAAAGRVPALAGTP
jgi:cell wall-associated NlpC family hydrolase